MEGIRERLMTLLWLGLAGSACLTMLCAVDFKSWRTSGASGWSDGVTVWVVWGFVGSGTVLCLLLIAALTDAGAIERLDPSWVASGTLLASLVVTIGTSYYAWNHRRHLEETLMDGWMLHVSWGLVWAPWMAGATAMMATALLLFRIVDLSRARSPHRPATRPA